MVLLDQAKSTYKTKFYYRIILVLNIPLPTKKGRITANFTYEPSSSPPFNCKPTTEYLEVILPYWYVVKKFSKHSVKIPNPKIMTEEELAALNKELQTLEVEIQERRRKVLELNAKIADTIVSQDYEFTSTDGGKVKLSEMFGDKKNLFVIHNMGKGCSYCTMWADEVNGIYKYLEGRGKSAFVFMAGDDMETHKEFKKSRGWTFTSYSSKENGFTKEMGFQGEKGDFWPGVSVFEKTDDGKIRRVNRDWFGPTDMYCAVWHYIEMLPHERINQES